MLAVACVPFLRLPFLEKTLSFRVAFFICKKKEPQQSSIDLSNPTKMAQWCAANLRNCEGWKSSGLELSTTSDECSRMFDASLRQIVSWADCEVLGGLRHTMVAMFEADPAAVMPRALSLGLNGLGTEKVARANAEFRQELENLEKDAAEYGNPREQKHAKAVALWGRGYHRAAADLWNEILEHHHNDLLAVKFAHDAHFFMGDCKGKRDSVQKVIGKWNSSEPCYSFLHGMLAFGLEECEEYENAEKEANKALELNRFDCWATHAKAHVMEMNGRYEEGINFMLSTEEDWKQGWIIAAHNYWHTSLFYIEKSDYESALAIYDKEVAHRYNRTHSLLDMVDAASLLWRLELEGVDVGKERWQKVENLGVHVDQHSIVFNDVHMGPALFRQGEEETEQKLYDSLISYANTTEEDNAKISARTGLPLYEGMLAFARKNYDEAAKKLIPIRRNVYEIGGSHAQRDIFTQTLIQSCILAGDESLWKMTPQLLRERNDMKSPSPLAERLAQKFRAHHPISPI
ncbi:unnamed protein product [Caenorhabditis auriculariae]|uniref:Tetratricopeptide repeat protein 38 n=1 Tax=Caenorhabditis auriculariae TaxID=2777116 RepID=A0A8S1HFJ4_9PELO|nr:unnamed protein product [Caenorhabditis auriculariae]